MLEITPAFSRCLARLGAALVLLFASALGGVADSGAGTGGGPGVRSIRLGYYDAKPSCYRDERGQPRGIFIEVLDELAKRERWSVEYVFESWDELLADLKAGRIDLVPAIVETAQRESFAVFTRESVMTDWGAVFSRAGKAPSSVARVSFPIQAPERADEFLELPDGSCGA